MADLCTIANVKDFMNNSDSGNDAALTLFVDWVSRRMESYTDRQITLVSARIEKIRHSGPGDEIVLNDRIDTLTTVVEGTTTLASDEFEALGERRIARKSGETYIEWARGKITVTYDAGYTTIPTDWVFMAVKQCAFEFRQHGKSVAAVFGELSRSGTGGETVALVPPTWLDDVKDFLDAEKRRFA